MPAIMPSPGGGMTMEKVRAMGDVYGDDVLLLIGGSLIGHTPDLVTNARFFLDVAGRRDLYGPLEVTHHPVLSPDLAPASSSSAEARELVTLRRQYAAMETKLEQLTAMVMSNSGGSQSSVAAEAGSGAGTTLPPGAHAPLTPVDGNYSKVYPISPNCKYKAGHDSWTLTPESSTLRCKLCALYPKP